MEKFECPADGNKCDFCVGLAQDAMAVTLHEAGFTNTRARLSAENAQLAPLVNDDSLPDRALNMLECGDRQVRAQNIGQHLAETILNHSE